MTRLASGPQREVHNLVSAQCDSPALRIYFLSVAAVEMQESVSSRLSLLKSKVAGCCFKMFSRDWRDLFEIIDLLGVRRWDQFGLA